MAQLIIQYVLIAAVVVGLAYFAYLLKDKGIALKEDYFGIANTIFAMLEKDENTSENIKNILRAVSKAVDYVEANYKDEDNNIKEEKAFEMAKQTIVALNLKSTISDENIKYIIRISAALLPPTAKQI